MCDHFLICFIYAVLKIYIIVFNIWLSKWEKDKNKEVRSSISHLNPLEVTSARRVTACINVGKGNNNGCLPLCLNLCAQKQQSMIREQIPDIWRTELFSSTLPPISMCKLLQKHVHICLSCVKGQDM